MDNRDVLISLRGLTKSYPKQVTRGGRISTLWSLLAGDGGNATFHALDGVSLDVCRGESLGVIGENGAGKSTLLKIVAGVVKPSRGSVSVNASVGALLELGAGFNPEYSGRDNIYLSASLIGMTRKHVMESLQSIIDFADIGEAIDQPVKTYSSGMIVRLGFALATAMRPDILITDEVLAVGDESFQKRCTRWIERYLSEGGTLLLCAHSMFHIRKLCRHTLWLHHGKVRMYGDTTEVTREYLAYHEHKDAVLRDLAKAPDSVPVSGAYRLESVTLRCGNEEGCETVAMGGSFRVAGELYSPDGRPPAVAVGIVRIDGTSVYGVVSDMDGYQAKPVSDHAFTFELVLSDLPLLPGHYRVRVHPMDPEGIRMYETVELPIVVTGETRELGLCRIDHQWI